MHLLEALRGLYTVTEDWTGTLFSGLTIQWNYAGKYVDISMPHYIPAMLHRFQHPKPAKHQGAPHSWTAPSYGASVQYASLPDDSPILSATKITTIQQKVGTLLYYAVSVDPFMLAALGTIASSQAKATQRTKNECLWLTDYAASNPTSVIRYSSASDMVLYIHSDASYLSETKARSRGAGHFFLSSKPNDPTKPPRHHAGSQRACSHDVQKHRRRCRIRRRSRNWCRIYQRPRRRSHCQHATRIRPPTTANSHPS
jgi:hypothetical protein